MNILELLAKDNQEWLRMAFHITKDQEKADELLQEFYIRIYETNEKKELNLDSEYDSYKHYIFICLRNLSRSIWKKNKSDDNYNWKILSDSIDECQEELEQKEAFENFYQNIENYMKFEYKEDKKNKHFQVGLMKLNLLDGMSQREIAANTGITLRVVHKEIKKIKTKIQEKYQDEYNNYKNKLKINGE